jgi:hypothetical protein
MVFENFGWNHNLAGIRRLPCPSPPMLSSGFGKTTAVFGGMGSVNIELADLKLPSWRQV